MPDKRGALETNLTTGETRVISKEEMEKSLEVDPPTPSDALVHLPTIISNEFGIARSAAREQIERGDVFIDGERWQRDRLDIPHSVLLGREIVVKGRSRIFRMTYEEPSPWTLRER
jgi:hypothetical protein